MCSFIEPSKEASTLLWWASHVVRGLLQAKQVAPVPWALKSRARCVVTVQTTFFVLHRDCTRCPLLSPLPFPSSTTNTTLTCTGDIGILPTFADHQRVQRGPSPHCGSFLGCLRRCVHRHPSTPRFFSRPSYLCYTAPPQLHGSQPCGFSRGYQGRATVPHYCAWWCWQRGWGWRDWPPSTGSPCRGQHLG